MAWITFTIFAALMQAVRTAGQKHMTQNNSALVATWARYGFGLPLAIAYLLILFLIYPTGIPAMTPVFFAYVSCAAIAQLVATGLLVKALSLRNFAVGTTYAKTEGIFAALFGFVIFGTQLSAQIWLAILLGISGLVFVSVQKAHLSTKSLMSRQPLALGLGAGAGFAITAVFVRAANLQLSTPPLLSAAIILALSILIQLALCSILVHRQSRQNWRAIARNTKSGWFVGITGTLGSVGWYTAFAYQEAAIVKTLGQVEFVFTVLLTTFFFKERISKAEWIGMSLVLGSVLILLNAKAG